MGREGGSANVDGVGWGDRSGVKQILSELYKKQTSRIKYHFIPISLIEQAKDIPFKGFSDADIVTTLLENVVIE